MPATSSPRSRPTRRRWNTKRSMRAASGKSSFRKARRASRSTQPIAVLLEEGEDEAALADVGSAGPGRAGIRKEVGGRSRRNRRGAAAIRPDTSAAGPSPRPSPRARGEGRTRCSGRVRGSGRRRAAMVRPAFSPARWRGAWPCMPGSIWRRSAAPVRRAASSRRISSERSRSRARYGRTHVRSRLRCVRPRPRRSPPGCMPSRRRPSRRFPCSRKSRCWRSPATRPTARSRIPRCAGSSRGGSPSRSRPSRISICRSIARSTNC